MAGRPWGDDDVPMPCSSVMCAVLDGEAVLYDVASGRALLLNTTAAQVWMMLGKVTVAELAERLGVAHGIEVGRLAADLRQVLGQLEDADALERG